MWYFCVTLLIPYLGCIELLLMQTQHLLLSHIQRIQLVEQQGGYYSGAVGVQFINSQIKTLWTKQENCQ